MKAKEFISEELLKELKFVDQLLTGNKLSVAARLFNRNQHKYDDPYEAMRQIAKITGLRPRILQDYLIDGGFLEENES